MWELALEALAVGGLLVVIVRQRRDLRGQRLEVERLVTTDPLTKLLNRRTFDGILDREVERAKRSGKFPSLIFLDIEGFKELNEQQGHAMGDEVLQRVATAIRSAIRFEIDVPCRYGGDEFVVILPETPSAHAVKVGQRIQEILQPQQISVNLGAMECLSGWSSHVLVQRVDQAIGFRKSARPMPTA